MPVHHRILLKLSGEALMGDDSFGINPATIGRIVEEIAEAVSYTHLTLPTKRIV